MTIIAQAAQSFTASQLLAALAIVAFLAGLALTLKKLFAPNPPLHREYVSKADHDKFREETLAELKRHAGRRAEIYDEQKAQGEKISGLSADMQAQGEAIRELKHQIHETDRRIDAVPMRTIQLLRETRDLHS